MDTCILWEMGPFRMSTIGTTIAAIEVNNDTYCLQKGIEKFPLFSYKSPLCQRYTLLFLTVVSYFLGIFAWKLCNQKITKAGKGLSKCGHFHTFS